MLNLEQQVCSLELAQKLKALNVKQESLFYWKQDEEGDPFLVFHNSRYMNTKGEILASAFLSSELGDMLPSSTTYVGNDVYIEFGKSNITGYWIVMLRKSSDPRHMTVFISEPHEADARAKMLIHLLENSLIPLPIKG